jgi:protein SCO1/2
MLIISAAANLKFYAGQDTGHEKVGIDEKLGQYIPKGLVFYNEDGKTVKLDSLINMPVVFAPVYYHCPGICSPLMLGIAEVVDRVDMEPGKDFKVITLSFDPSEKPADAKKWKNEHLNSMRRTMSDDSWIFLTGDSTNIKKLLDAVGFYYNPEGRNDFAHPTSLIMLSHKGLIARYIFGTSFLPFDLKMAVIDASHGRPIPTVNKFLEYCFSYDRSKNSYVFNVTKVAAGIMIFFTAVFFMVLVIKKNKVRKV